MEHIEFGGRSSQEELGRGLAKMHLAPVKVSEIEGSTHSYMQARLYPAVECI